MIRILFAVFALWPAFSTTRVVAQTADPLSAAMTQALAQEKLVGATWALVYRDSVLLGASGIKDVSRNAPMSPGDRVQVGSIAKTLIATGILQLVTRGRIALDAPVTRYLTDIPFENPWDSTSPLLVRHLLDHTGGLDDARMWQVFSLDAHPDTPLRDGLLRSGGSVRIRHRPGDRFSYSNTSFLMLGMLIEAVTRERYETWLDRELLSPLGMTRSTFKFVTQTGEHGDTSLAMGHFDQKTTSASVPTNVRPASQFTTTAGDMARLARFLMSSGQIEGQVLVDSALLRGMGKPVATESARAGLAGGYGSGLLRRDRHGVIGLCHLGNVGTFRAAICLYPEEERAFFIAHNVDPENANFDRLDGMLVKALGLSYPLVQQTQPPAVDPRDWEGMYLVRPSRFAQFAYLDELGGVTSVRWDGATLKLLPVQGNGRALTPVGGAFFRAEDRVQATHVLARSTDNRRIIADGLRTLERVDPLHIYAHWTSAAVGILALLYVLLVGGVRSIRGLQRRQWRSEHLKWPTLCLALLIVAPALYFTQSFLAIGDPTPANVTIALLTGALPLTLIIAGVHRITTGLGSRGARTDMLAIAGALQWCVVLASWGMLPLALWR